MSLCYRCKTDLCETVEVRDNRCPCCIGRHKKVDKKVNNVNPVKEIKKKRKL